MMFRLYWIPKGFVKEDDAKWWYREFKSEKDLAGYLAVYKNTFQKYAMQELRMDLELSVLEVRYSTIPEEVEVYEVKNES